MRFLHIHHYKTVDLVMSPMGELDTRGRVSAIERRECRCGDTDERLTKVAL